MDTYQLQRIISDGQTGIDQMGLSVAQSFGIPTSGVAPRVYLTENVPDERLLDYGLSEHATSKHPPRTRINVQQSDGIVIFSNVTGGTKLTLDTYAKEGKPYLLNPAAERLRFSNLTLDRLEHYWHVLTAALRLT